MTPTSSFRTALFLAGLPLVIATTPFRAEAVGKGIDVPSSAVQLVSERHHRRHRRTDPAAEAQPGDVAPRYGSRSDTSAGYSGPVPPGGFYNPRVNNGSNSQYAPNDPQRPFGVNSTVTAPTGTAAAQEQENNRRYFCNFSPERC